MNTSTSPKHIAQQVEFLNEELKECKKTSEHLQSSEMIYRNLVESANEAMLVAQNGMFQADRQGFSRYHTRWREIRGKSRLKGSI